MTGKRIKGLGKYETKAKAIMNDYSITYEQRQKKLQRVAKDFANYIVKHFED